MTVKDEQPLNREVLLKEIFRGKMVIECGMDQSVFGHGQPADSLFYLRRGMAKLTVISPQGKEAIIAILEQRRCCCRDDEPHDDIRKQHSGNDIGAHPFQFDFRNGFAGFHRRLPLVNLLLDFLTRLPEK